MIERLVGTCVVRQPHGFVIVDVHGVGYGVEIPTPALTQINEGQEVTLWIHSHLSEDSLRLFGFLDQMERHLFGVLLSVSRIGPKLGLAILSSIAARRLVEIVERDDAASLASVPGIGAQSAKKFVLELKPKIEKLAAAQWWSSATSTTLVSNPQERDQVVIGDVRSILLNFGYKDREIHPILTKMKARPYAGSLQELVKFALGELMGQGAPVTAAPEEVF